MKLCSALFCAAQPQSSSLAGFDQSVCGLHAVFFENSVGRMNWLSVRIDVQFDGKGLWVGGGHLAVPDMELSAGTEHARNLCDRPCVLILGDEQKAVKGGHMVKPRVRIAHAARIHHQLFKALRCFSQFFRRNINRRHLRPVDPPDDAFATAADIQDAAG